MGGEDSKPHAYSLLKLDGTERKLKTKKSRLMLILEINLLSGLLEGADGEILQIVLVRRGHLIIKMK